MKEWEDRFNPFNSMKILRHWDRLEACAKGHYLTPLTVNVDPTNKCNFDCCFCNSDFIVKNSQETMSEEHLLKLADFFGSWGKDTPEGHPKSCYISGGGEPLMNPATPKFIERLTQNGIQSAIITNGTFLNETNIPIILKNCKWIGISVDATCNETFNVMKGLPEKFTVYNALIDKIRLLVHQKYKLDSDCDIGFKFLLHPNNYREMLKAALLAKNLKVNTFHVRPVRYLNFSKIDSSVNFTESYTYINEQFDKIQDLNEHWFRVYGVRHKFNSDLSIKKNFSRCRVIPIEPTFSSDGRVHCCFDMRGREDLILCNHYPNPEEIASFWNSEKHKSIINSIDVNSCPSCTFSSYNEAIEKAVIEDRMDINFC